MEYYRVALVREVLRLESTEVLVCAASQKAAETAATLEVRKNKSSQWHIESVEFEEAYAEMIEKLEFPVDRSGLNFPDGKEIAPTLNVEIRVVGVDLQR